MPSAFPLVKIGGSTTSYNFTMIPAPTGWQPWDVAAHYQVTFWDYEFISNQSALVANCIDNATSPATWTRIWIPVANVTPSG